RKLFDVRFDSENRRFGKLFGKTIDDLASWAFAQIVDVRLERQSERGDLHLVDALRLGDELVENESGLRVVDIASGLDERRLLRSCCDDEPRVHGDAVSADSGARLQ